MKPPTTGREEQANCVCLAENLDITITDMASGCQQSWSQKMPGPTGTFGSQQSGWALFSTPGNCLNMSDSHNFYSDSPGQTTSSTATVATTTTTTTTTSTAITTLLTSDDCDLLKLEFCYTTE